MFRAEKRLIAVELTGNSIKICEAEAVKGKRKVTRLVKKALASKDDATLPAEIKSLFESLNIGKHKICLNIPRHLTTVRFLRLPSIDDKEIEKIVKIESVKHLPYSNEDIVYGFKIIQKFEDGYSSILLALVQASIVDRLISILNQAGLEIELISLGSETFLQWYLLSVKDAAGQDAMIVNIDSDSVDIDVISEGTLSFTRGFTYEDGPTACSRILDQIKISRATHQKESGDIVNRIILTGRSGLIKECEGPLKESLEIQVEPIDHLENISIKEDAEIETADASFAELLGLCLSSKDLKIDLTPEDVQMELRIRESRKRAGLTLILVALIVMTALGLGLKKMHDKTIMLSYINRELTRIEPEVAKAKKMMKDVNVITQEVEKRPFAIDILSEIHKLTPPNILLNLVDYESNRTLTVRGSAAALSDVFKYVSVLEGSQYFRNVKVKYATKRMAQNQEVADFEINCSLT